MVFQENKKKSLYVQRTSQEETAKDKNLKMIADVAEQLNNDPTIYILSPLSLF
jgi:hypothetical protein